MMAKALLVGLMAGMMAAALMGLPQPAAAIATGSVLIGMGFLAVVSAIERAAK